MATSSAIGGILRSLSLMACFVVPRSKKKDKKKKNSAYKQEAGRPGQLEMLHADGLCRQEAIEVVDGECKGLIMPKKKKKKKH